MNKLLDLYVSFFKIGGLTFGGGLAMLPMLKREVVEIHGWTTEEEVLDIYAIGQCTPGIIAVNTATYIGHKEAGIKGGIIATLGIISPSIIIICLAATLLNTFMTNPLLLHAFEGIRIVVCALMLHTVINMARKGITDKLGAIICFITFLLCIFTPIPTVLLVIAAAFTGVIAKRREAKHSS